MNHTLTRDTTDARYDGMYIGEVTRNDDPDNRQRIQVQIGAIYENGSPWVEPLNQMRGVNNGVYWAPEIGSNVAVWFHQGDVDFPYYLPAQFGLPQGQSDVPEEGRDVDRFVLRWRDFYIQIDGTQGQEKLTIKDLPTQTRLEIERANGGDMTTDVRNDRIETVVNDLTTTVGMNISINSGQQINLTSGTDMNLTATGPLTVQGNSTVDLNSVGAMTMAVLSVFNAVFSGVVTWTFALPSFLLGALISIGLGPYRKLVNEDVFTLWANSHTHAGPGSPPTQKVILGGTSPDVDLNLVTTTNLIAS